MEALPRITDNDLLLRVGVIALAAVTPFICILTQGSAHSLSYYWKTDLQPLFIFTNILTAYYFLNINNWRFSALLLLLLTAFSVDLYGTLHDILATMFFLANVRPLYLNHHYRWVILLYLMALPILHISMLWSEIVAIESLCLHQGLMLRKLHKLNSTKK